jgi:hypothetical protein
MLCRFSFDAAAMPLPLMPLPCFAAQSTTDAFADAATITLEKPPPSFIRYAEAIACRRRRRCLPPPRCRGAQGLRPICHYFMPRRC